MLICYHVTADTVFVSMKAVYVFGRNKNSRAKLIIEDNLFLCPLALCSPIHEMLLTVQSLHVSLEFSSILIKLGPTSGQCVYNCNKNSSYAHCWRSLHVCNNGWCKLSTDIWYICSPLSWKRVFLNWV